MSAQSSGSLIWRFDPDAWNRIQRAVGQPAKGNPDAVWHLIDQGLVFASIEQLRQSLPLPNENRTRKQRLLAATDSLIDLLGINTPSSTGYSADGQVLNWLIHGALRQLHPSGPRLGENSRRERIPVHKSLAMIREDYGSEIHIAAQKRVLELERQLGPSLSLLRELLALSDAETASAPLRGATRNLPATVFVHYTAMAYEAAYERAAGPGRSGAAGEAGPAVRFVAAVAGEAGKADMIAGPLPGPDLRMLTPNGIRRLLLKRRAP